MSDIFYSGVDMNLRAELNARAGAARRKTNQDINYMHGKIANVTVTPYGDPAKQIKLINGILGGSTVRSIDYLPDGYLNTELKRVKPYITSTDLVTADHAMGLMNTATLNIHIPDPDADLEFIESIYFRPGRPIEISIEHSDSIVLTNTYLSESTLPSLTHLENLYGSDPNYTEKYRKINRTTFEGLITTFSFTYNSDLSVTATISARGRNTLIPDLTMIVNSDKTIQGKQEIKENSKLVAQNRESFFNALKNEIEKSQSETAKKKEKCLTCRKKIPCPYIGPTKKTNFVYSPAPEYAVGAFGEPVTGMGTQQYISLQWLIDFMNTYILSKVDDPTAVIAFDPVVTKSNAYPPDFYVSSRPDRMFWNTRYRNIKKPEFTVNLFKTDKESVEFPKFNQGGHCSPSAIMVNMQVIKEALDTISLNNEFLISTFLNTISAELYELSGHAIELKLITHPDDARFLLWYDVKYAPPGPTPYRIPMTSNNAYGQIVRDFSFSAAIPQSAATLAYVANQDSDSIIESDIAPWLSYMYDNVKSNPGAIESLQKAISDLSADIHNTSIQKNVQDALQKYIQNPDGATNPKSAFILPFETEFTIDGINGFRYGDVLDFELLPSRYTSNAVFSVVSVTHTCGSDGVWTTKIRSLMRPKI